MGLTTGKTGMVICNSFRLIVNIAELDISVLSVV